MTWEGRALAKGSPTARLWSSPLFQCLKVFEGFFSVEFLVQITRCGMCGSKTRLWNGMRLTRGAGSAWQKAAGCQVPRRAALSIGCPHHLGSGSSHALTGHRRYWWGHPSWTW